MATVMSWSHRESIPGGLVVESGPSSPRDSVSVRAARGSVSPVPAQLSCEQTRSDVLLPTAASLTDRNVGRLLVPT